MYNGFDFRSLDFMFFIFICYGRLNFSATFVIKTCYTKLHFENYYFKVTCIPAFP